MLNILRRLPKFAPKAEPPAIKAEDIIARISADINAELRLYLSCREKRAALNFRAPDLLEQRQAYSELMAHCYDAANALYHVAEACGFTDQLQIDADLTDAMRVTLAPLAYRAA